MSKAATYQPKPRKGSAVVLPHVLKDITERADFGLGKHGTYLQAHNGRDAMWDAYQELIDLVMYFRTELLNRETEPADESGRVIDPDMTLTPGLALWALVHLQREPEDGALTGRWQEIRQDVATALQLIADREYVVVKNVLLDDGFGANRSIVCPDCSGPTMQVVRPGSFACTNCNHLEETPA